MIERLAITDITGGIKNKTAKKCTAVMADDIIRATMKNRSLVLANVTRLAMQSAELRSEEMPYGYSAPQGRTCWLARSDAV